jgi:hypothetical protein
MINIVAYSRFLVVAANVRGYEMCRFAEMLPYPTIQNLMRDKTLENPLNPSCFMIRCWVLAFFPYNLSMQLFI